MRSGILLSCEGVGDCLFAIPVIRKLNRLAGPDHLFDLFTLRPEVFRACPYVDRVHSLDTFSEDSYPHPVRILFEPVKLPHARMDTFDFMTIPLGIGELSFREKQLEYFPSEKDGSRRYDVVLHTSRTWPSRSWSIDNWQRLADWLLKAGYSVAVVGKDLFSHADKMWKQAEPLKNCVNLVNELSFDQTYFTIRKCGLFVSCQNGLSVLAGATDTEIVVLDMSIEWSKRAIYRNETPHYKVTYVKGACDIYCELGAQCVLPTDEPRFTCIPSFERVRDAVANRLHREAASR